VRVSEKRVLRRILGSKRNEIISWRIRINKAHHNMYSSPIIITMMKSRRMRSTGHVAFMGDSRNTYRIFVDVGGPILFEWILEKENGVVWSGLIWLRIRTADGILRTW
jgi:hypothetical protein